MPRDQRLAANSQKRFGRVVGEGAHAFAPPGSKDHGFHGDANNGRRAPGTAAARIMAFMASR
jgi:hypothetical protein